MFCKMYSFPYPLPCSSPSRTRADAEGCRAAIPGWKAGKCTQGAYAHAGQPGKRACPACRFMDLWVT
ncbi:hypothetical protein B5F76_02715 [Desulfovibrio sp. An276]|nr:hypothetical protein B5F76_02715 [Desulfovibrio sp. An276]